MTRRASRKRTSVRRTSVRRNSRSRKPSDKLRDQERPEVFGYELDREALQRGLIRPLQGAPLNLASGDYGSDPIGPSPEGFMFRMVPSGDVVDQPEMERRLKARGLRRNSKKTDSEAEARGDIERARRHEYDRAEKAIHAEISRFMDASWRTLMADGGANRFQVYYVPYQGHLQLVQEGDRPSSNLELAWSEPLSGFLTKEQLTRDVVQRLRRVPWLGPDMHERVIMAAKPEAPSPKEYRGFRIEKSDPDMRGKPYYEIFYPDGGSKTVSTMKAAREYIDNYLGDA